MEMMERERLRGKRVKHMYEEEMRGQVRRQEEGISRAETSQVAAKWRIIVASSVSRILS